MTTLDHCGLHWQPNHGDKKHNLKHLFRFLRIAARPLNPMDQTIDIFSQAPKKWIVAQALLDAPLQA
ncbi:hypothetical protein ACROAE_17690 [Shewanella sp. MF05960]|uniref:hypothetical protein n=1 Tax=Shewanella sp. MF05960 TaxID=3434874 RepID=UPI003D798BF7